ncbi:MAG: ABC transporter ATP-binding protein [Hyphomicrobiales bacterium]|nr:ABC transporter ATP-binding protein [Hyphomicrobiales bacterium]
MNNLPDADIEFRDVSKRFGDVIAVDNVSLLIKRGEFFSFLGPSGCGKTTSLRLIAGFEQPTTGGVQIGGTSVIGVPPHKRPVNMVFQHYALFPHMTVAENIGFGLRQRKPKPSRSDMDKQVDESLEMVRMSGYGNRRIWEMSGGQQQRVALARALINRPTVLLLDEPLAALDRKLRRDMQIELQTLQREVGITFILVTHDQEEALSMSDQICIMREGRVEQLGSPRELYDLPVNRYVADFVGKTNFIAGTVSQVSGGTITLETEKGMSFSGRHSPETKMLSPGDNACVAIRPELMLIGSDSESAADMNTDIALSGQIKNQIFLGEHTEYLVATDIIGDVLVLSPKYIESRHKGFGPGDRVSVGWKNEIALVLEDS